MALVFLGLVACEILCCVVGILEVAINLVGRIETKVLMEDRVLGNRGLLRQGRSRRTAPIASI